MKRADIISSLLIISIIVNIYFVSLRLFLKDKYQKIQYAEYSFENVLNRERKLADIQLQSDKIYIGNLLVYSKDFSKKVNIKDLLRKKTLVYKFSPNSCFTCVKSDLQLIKKLSKVIDKNKILILTEYSNYREYKSFINIFQPNINCLNLTTSINLPINSDDNSIPYYFVINENYFTEFVHARKEQDSLGCAYFNTVKRYLK